MVLESKCPENSNKSRKTKVALSAHSLGNHACKTLKSRLTEETAKCNPWGERCQCRTPKQSPRTFASGQSPAKVCCVHLCVCLSSSPSNKRPQSYAVDRDGLPFSLVFKNTSFEGICQTPLWERGLTCLF